MTGPETLCRFENCALPVDHFQTEGSIKAVAQEIFVIPAKFRLTDNRQSLDQRWVEGVTKTCEYLLASYAGTFANEHSQKTKRRFGLSFTDENPGQVDLGLRVGLLPQGMGMECAWVYRPELFEDSTIARIHTHFSNVLQQVFSNPGIQATDVQLMGEAELSLVTREWNQTASNYPSTRSIAELFEEVAVQFGDGTAVDDLRRQCTYKELNAAANRLARHLVVDGCKPGTLVGVQLNRSVDMVVAILAILKAGCGYVPLDIDYPAERLRLIINDTGVRFIITNLDHWDSYGAADARPIFVDAAAKAIAMQTDTNLGIVQDAERAAYVMYTSGSTGEPKGALIPQRAVVRLVRNTNFVEFGPTEVFAQIANSSFDAVTFELWGALLHGGRLVILPKEVVLSPPRFGDAIERHGLSAMFLTSELFNLLVERIPEKLARVRHLMVGGDAVDAGSARKLLAAAGPGKLINGYGPTESTTFALTHWIREVGAEDRSVPIGRPIANTLAYILDRQLRPVPIGVVGHLYLGGDGLATKYLNRPELTDERFVHVNVSGNGPERLYATGDLARFRGDGTVDCLGRIDQQVKIRGFRIELGEVESAIRKCEGVGACVVIARSAHGGTKRMLAYVVAGLGQKLDKDVLRSELTRTLPEFMIPSAITVMDAFPLSPNGKVDRAALPEPLLFAEPAGPLAGITPVQKSVQAVWAKVLRVPEPGLDHNFFELGGSSIQLPEMEAELEKDFKDRFCTMDLFRFTTIRTLAEWLERGNVPVAVTTNAARERATRQGLAFSTMRQGRRT